MCRDVSILANIAQSMPRITLSDRRVAAILFNCRSIRSLRNRKMSSVEEEYAYDVDRCSVQDKARLRAFRNKRSEWVGWLERDACHNIWSQLHLIMWNDAVYRCLNEARRFASEINPTASLSGMLGEFLDRGYLSTQILDICKLTDRSNEGPERGVISLRRLLDDIRNHRDLLTRENFVSYDGLPYDYAAVRQAYFDNLTPAQRGKVRWMATKGPDAWGISEIKHSAFDKLSGVAPDERTRTDLIHNDVFQTIENWFAVPILRKLRTHRNKFVGHAAGEISRQNAPLDRLGVSLDELAEAQRVVVRIATAIGSHILYDTALGGVVPTPQFNVFEYLEMPVIRAENMAEIADWWRSHRSGREEWLRERVDLITGRITPSA
jgi:hypothetical protein